MTFPSFSFFLFLPAVFLVFSVVPNRFRWMILLIASYFFYGSFLAPHLVLSLILVTGVSFIVGKKIGRAETDIGKKTNLFLGIGFCLVTLVLVRLLPLILMEARFKALGNNVLLTIGVSYFTFQAISYLVDVYLEVQAPEEHLGYFSLYMAFFPKILQGPIERGGDLLPQLKSPWVFRYEAMRLGMLLFFWGVFKKVVVADRLAVFSDLVFNDVQVHRGLPLLIGTYAYAFQIYFDFSGYTDMARGIGQFFGVNLSENFQRPYSAISVADFWRRWHISFSRWILDYIFKPLQMAWRDWGKPGAALALIVTFLVSGLWHGSSGGFLVWGLIHGIYMAGAIFTRDPQKRFFKGMGIEKSPWLKRFQIFATFHLICFAWIFFRTRSLSDAQYILTNLFNIGDYPAMLSSIGVGQFIRSFVFLHQGKFQFALVLAGIGIVWAVQALQDQKFAFMEKPHWFRWTVYYALMLMIIIFGTFEKSQFIYFQF
jgi:D-alanyl-lipoteichoic acid acyltransferase DltB (MBOAT superfamily)